ncbi:uncharacterized protein [Amphiura filiformis]|uniref:uncharacterized protein n=1 Tax=Amphiura filiformis TaxID=82378 RepID=UPI003B21881E
MSPNLDFTSSELPITPSSVTLNYPNRPDFDCVEQKIYVTDEGRNAADDQFIARFNRDGSEAEFVVNFNDYEMRPIGIYVDDAKRRIFWGGKGDSGGTFVSDITGASTRRLSPGPARILNIALNRKTEKLYVTNDEINTRPGVYTLYTNGTDYKRIISKVGLDDYQSVALDGKGVGAVT